MLISQKNKVLYVAVPKTGTTAIQEWLELEDESFVKGKCVLDGNHYGLGEHFTANMALNSMGKEYFNTLSVIAFCRNPYSRLVSSYNFYRQGGKSKSILKAREQKIMLKLKKQIKVLSARLLPFWLWSLIYPYMDNKRYFFDKNGKLIVTHIGRFEEMKTDLTKIIKDIGLDVDINNLRTVNKSKPKATSKIFESKIFTNLLKIRHRNFKYDLDFYNKVNNEDIGLSRIN